MRIVQAVRRGASLRSAARRFKVHLRTVQRWIERAGDQRLSRADLRTRSSGPRTAANRTPRRTEQRILALRRELKEQSALGEYGARAIRQALIDENARDIPCVRTIGRILSRHGVLDGNRRVRRPPPPRGWYLPDLAAGEVELDSFDIVEDLVIQGGVPVNVLNGISLYGGLCASWPEPQITAKIVVERLVEHWRRFGLPAYCQFDNGTVFQGAHQWPDSFGRVTRLCLSLGVTPVFAPPRETGFQAAIEGYNGRWQSKVWRRFAHPDRDALRWRSDAFVAAAHARGAARIDAAPQRRPMPVGWTFDLQTPLKGTAIFIRRTNENGCVHLLGHQFPVSGDWPHRLVRSEVDLTRGAIRFHALRRREPRQQPLLKEQPYATPNKRFNDRR